MAWYFFVNMYQLLGTYQKDNDKCSHLSDPHTSLHLDRAATSSRLRSPSRSFLWEKERETNTLDLTSQGKQFKICLNKSIFAVTTDV